MWTLYDHPTDMPEHYILRLWDGMTCQPTRFIFCADTLDGVQEQLDAIPGRWFRMPAGDQDDPKIIAVFL